MITNIPLLHRRLSSREREQFYAACTRDRINAGDEFPEPHMQQVIETHWLARLHWRSLLMRWNAWRMK
jgi:hypothetical protein